MILLFTHVPNRSHPKTLHHFHSKQVALTGLVCATIQSFLWKSRYVPGTIHKHVSFQRIHSPRAAPLQRGAQRIQRCWHKMSLVHSDIGKKLNVPSLKWSRSGSVKALDEYITHGFVKHFYESPLVNGSSQMVWSIQVCLQEERHAGMSSQPRDKGKSHCS